MIREIRGRASAAYVDSVATRAVEIAPVLTQSIA